MTTLRPSLFHILVLSCLYQQTEQHDPQLASNQAECWLNPIWTAPSQLQFRSTHSAHLRKADIEALHPAARRERESVASGCRVLPIRGIMFKIGRSGSTLLTNMLQADSSLKIVEEPHALSEVVTWASKSSEPTQISEVKRVLDALALASNESQTSVFLNVMSQVFMIPNAAALIRAAVGPLVPVYYLTRSTDQVYRSLVAHSPRWLQNYRDPSEYIHAALNAVMAYDVLDPAFSVYDYADVLSFELPRLIVGLEPTKSCSTTIEKSWTQLVQEHSKTGKPRIRKTNESGKIVDYAYEFADRRARKTLVDNVDFRVRFPPAGRLIQGALPMQQADEWLGLSHRSPYVWRNAHNGSLQSQAQLDEIISSEQHPMLRTINQPGYFVWQAQTDHLATHSANMTHTPCQSKWVEATYSEWKQNHDWQLISSSPTQLIDRYVPQILTKIPSSRKDKYALRVSHAGSVTALHIDHSDSVLIQVRGRKRVLFFPPNAFCTYPEGHCLSRRSLLNLQPIPPTLWHSISLDGMITAVLHPGDVLFFPALWGHWMMSETETVSMGKRFEQRLDPDGEQVSSLQCIASQEQITIAEAHQPWAHGVSKLSTNQLHQAAKKQLMICAIVVCFLYIVYRLVCVRPKLKPIVRRI